MANKNYQRRKFIKNGALGMAAFTIVPRHVIGKGFVAPSDKLRIAGIGAGGKGQSDLAEFAKSPNVDIVALVDVDDRAAAKSRQSFPKASYYHDFREMLEKEMFYINPGQYTCCCYHCSYAIGQTRLHTEATHARYS